MSKSSTHRPVLSVAGRRVLVAGGTGNVGRHIVHALIQRGATVAVPSRSPAKLDALRTAIAAPPEQLVTIIGNVADDHDSGRISHEISRRLGAPPDAVVATLGRWINAPALLAATRAELVGALESYVIAHFVVARTFLPLLVANGGSYTMINGPSAFSTWPGSGLVSVATAAQAMLAQALAAEREVGESVRLTNLVIHPSSLIGPGTAEDGGPIDGPAVGRFVAGLIAGQVAGPTTIHLESPEQVAAVA